MANIKAIEYLSTRLDWLYEDAVRGLPPRAAGCLDLVLRPDFCKKSRPFTGQERRKELFQELTDAVSFNAIVETGTARGATAEYLGRRLKIPVYTVEKNERYYYYSSLRLRRLPNVRAILDDSRAFLKKVRDDPAFPKKRVLFYLDAHGRQDEPPLGEEVAAISNSWSESVVIIDDFQVPDDSGYHFAVYGNVIYCLKYLHSYNISNFEIFWPSAPSSAETYPRCGSVVLVTRDSLLETARRLKSLREIR